MPMTLHRLRFLFRRNITLGAPEPDFLCVGMVKAATDWLFDQLRSHPDFWIPPVKELRYLNLAKPRMDNTLRKFSQHKPGQERRSADGAADLAFVMEASVLAEQPRNLDAYAALFRFKGKRLSGDISPGYYDLDGPTIAAIAQHFPELKIVLLVREPLERVWSHICMRQREGHFDATLLNDVTAFAAWFAASEVRRACFATEVGRNWREFAPQIRFRHFLFDVVERTPQLARAEVITYLGGDPRKRSGRLPAGYNRKAGAPKLPMPEPIRTFLLNELADEIRNCASLFGGEAAGWPSRYGL